MTNCHQTGGSDAGVDSTAAASTNQEGCNGIPVMPLIIHEAKLPN
jgi:hypothetical protein